MPPVHRGAVPIITRPCGKYCNNFITSSSQVVTAFWGAGTPFDGTGEKRFQICQISPSVVGQSVRNHWVDAFVLVGHVRQQAVVLARCVWYNTTAVTVYGAMGKHTGAYFRCSTMWKGSGDNGTNTEITAANHKFLDRESIKYIAVFTMLMNHIAIIFPVPWRMLTNTMVYLGYFTGFVMIYFLVDGYYYTRSRRNYFRRMLFFTFLSQIPFDLAFTAGASSGLTASI